MRILRYLLWIGGNIVVSSFLLSQGTSPDSSTNATEAAFLRDVVTIDDGGKKADVAIRYAVATQNIRILTTGLRSPDPSVKIRCCSILSPYHDDDQKAYLRSALEDDAVWETWTADVTDARKMDFYVQIMYMISHYKVFTKPEDLSSKPHRHDLATYLQ